MASRPHSDDLAAREKARVGEGAVGDVMTSPVRDTVFISYSHLDRAWLDKLSAHLSPIRGSIELWDDTRIGPGDLWRNRIEAALAGAGAAVLLITANFIASEFIRDVELPRLLESAADGGCRVIPVIVRPSMFKYIPELSCFQPINSPHSPLSGLSEHEQDEVFVELTLTLLQELRRLPAGSQPARPHVRRSTAG
jgi:hypothetical protein